MNLGAVVVVATKAPFNSKTNLVPVPIQLIGKEKCEMRHFPVSYEDRGMVDGGEGMVSYNGLSAWERRRATAGAGREHACRDGMGVGAAESEWNGNPSEMVSVIRVKWFGW